jgi:AcrR family transcriptional regulator
MNGMSRKPAQVRGSTAPRRNSGQKNARRPQVKIVASNGTVERILEGARRVLIDRGYAEFTTRRVAEVVGMTVGNLTYHFPSKHELLRALITKLLADYARRFESFFPNLDALQGQEIDSLIRWAFTDSTSVDTVHIMRELWALALHDASHRRVVDDFYDAMMNGVVQLLQQVFPQVEIRKTRELVQLMSSLAEGLNVLYGTRRARAVPFERMIELAVGLVAVIAPDLRRPAEMTGNNTGARRGSAPRGLQPMHATGYD